MGEPVLFLLFNRPKLTQAAFAAIRKARPPRLYVAADGPRPTRPEDAALCREARRVIEQVDWPCEVLTLFRDANMGGPKGIPEAINWFFSREEQGIILEDDVVAHNDFFAFCKNLLHRYRADERVMHISGSNFQLGLQHGEGSLYFSKIPHCWGWATWAKAWERYETRMEYADMEEVMENVVLHVSAPDVLGWAPELLFRCVGDQVGHWDVRWWYSLMKHDGLAAVPNVNLARNIGFGKDATHTKGKSILGCTPLSSLETIIYPAEPVWDKYADKVDMRIYFGGTMRTPENLKKEIQARIAEGAPAENIRYVMGLGKKLFHEIKQGQP